MFVGRKWKRSCTHSLQSCLTLPLQFIPEIKYWLHLFVAAGKSTSQWWTVPSLQPVFNPACILMWYNIPWCKFAKSVFIKLSTRISSNFKEVKGNNYCWSRLRIFLVCFGFHQSYVFNLHQNHCKGALQISSHSKQYFESKGPCFTKSWIIR